MSDSNTPPLWLQVPEPCDLVRKFGTAVDVPAFGGRLEVDWSPGERVTSVGSSRSTGTRSYLPAVGCREAVARYNGNMLS